jgi:uncharacterized hydantoinase/oxoprolinase family protein
MNNAREIYAKGAHTVLDIQYHYVWKTKYSYEETIKKYIEDQKDEDFVFKVWDEKKDLSTSDEPLGP